MNKYYCFKCGDEGPPVEVDENRTLGLCGCEEWWSVGTVNQLCDYLNEVTEVLDVIGVPTCQVEPVEIRDEDDD